MTVLVTGGCGFIGSNLVKVLLKNQENVINVDKITYAGNIDNLDNIDSKSYSFIKADINDKAIISDILTKNNPKAILNLAAETHVDRSIENPTDFLYTNILGTHNLLECSRDYWINKLKGDEDFKFIHISTDEVYGSLDENSDSFTEFSQYKPNSPYSASKASSDHLVRAYNKTYGLPTIITNCSNNYGPHQHPEKLIPLAILKIISRQSIPIFGNGEQIRDWIHVNDHCQALLNVLYNAKGGSRFNIGGSNEISNLNLIRKICSIYDEFHNNNNLESSNKLIKFVNDRPGHDFRYSINSSFINKKLSWKPQINFDFGLKETIDHYVSIFKDV